MTFDHIPLDARFVSHDGKRYARIARTEREQVRRRSEAFGVLDAKGREIGHSYVIDREFWIIDGNSRSICEIERLDERLEETFLVEPHALRDGRKFGALPVASYRRFRTLEEAEAYGEGAIKKAAKRAA